MPGFMVFKELGLDFPDTMPEIAQGAIKSALAMVPGSWMLHGLGGEYNVDVDPVAEINKALDGGGSLGRIAGNAQGAAESAASGDAAGVADGVTSIAGEFWEAYKGWIPVESVEQTIISEAEAERQELTDENRRQAEGGTYKTVLAGSNREGVETIGVKVHLDVSFPKLLRAALEPDGSMDGPTIFPSADIHLCTVASVDTRQLTLGSDSAAAQFIQTLIGFFLFNVVPYLTISMKDVQVANVAFQLDGDTGSSVPTADVQLEYKEITWSYHVINGSNMNLYSVDFSYDIRNRKPPSGGLALGSMLNPFA